MKSGRRILFLATAVVSYVSAVPVNEVPRDSSPHYLFTFGDSYTQTGFDISRDKPNDANPIGNPSYPGYTTSGGPDWVGFLVTKYNTTQVLAYNFADGGATVDADVVTPNNGGRTIVEQVRIFSDNGGSKPNYAPWTSRDSTFGIWIGVNDVGKIWYGADVDKRIGQIMQSYFEQTEILYQAGARRFLFLGVPPVTRSPLALQNNNEAERVQWADTINRYNLALSQRISQFHSDHSDITTFAFDTNQPFLNVLNNPTLYGAPDATCTNPDGLSCLWWDSYHPGIAIHDTVAQAVGQRVGGAFVRDPEAWRLV